MWGYLFLNICAYTLFLLFHDDLAKPLQLLKSIATKFRDNMKKLCWISVTVVTNVRILKKDKRKRFISFLKLLADLPYSELLEIFVYHVQDIQLYDYNNIIKHKKLQDVVWDHKTFLNAFSFFRLSAIFPANVCSENLDVSRRELITISTVPLVIINFIIVLVVISIIKKVCKEIHITEWSGHVIVGILLAVMYGNQRITSTCLNLISCVQIGQQRRLFIHGETECWQLWQVFIIGYVAMATIPQCFVFLLGPPLVLHNITSKRQFMAALLFPLPFTFYWVYLIVKNKNKIHEASTNHSIIERSEVDNKVLGQVSGSYDVQKISPYISWQGIIETRRLALVLCSVLAGDDSVKYLLMTLISSIAFAGHLAIRPYNTSLVNWMSALSLYFQILVGQSCYALASFEMSCSTLSVCDITPTIPLFLTVYIGKLSSFILPIVLGCVCCFISVIKSLKTSYHLGE